MYKVEIKSLHRLAGAKESTQNFNTLPKAIQCFNSKCKWLGISSELVIENEVEVLEDSITLHNSDGYKITISEVK